MSVKHIAAVSLFLFFLLPSFVVVASDGYAFTHVNVVSMESERILSDQTVIVRNGKIEEIANTADLKLPSSLQVINGTGKYLMPGLAEMHAHIPGDKDPDYLKDTLFLYLSNGITTIRGMLGQPFHLNLREQAEKGEILSPRIFTSGPSMNGQSVKTVGQAREQVIAYKNAGYDFLKLHPGLSLEVFNEIDRAADDVQIPMAGHVSTAVGVRRALAAQYGSIDHIDGYLEGLVPESAKIDPSQGGLFGINFTDLVDLSLLDELVNSTVENGVWIVPTQSLFPTLSGEVSVDKLAALPEMRYLPKAQLQRYRDMVLGIQNAPQFDREKAERFNRLRRIILKALSDAGAGILMGSDAPQVFNVPGFSIQHEIAEMARAGMTPYQILKSGTVNPAIYLGREGEFGVVAKGASADLLLLNGNPLEDLTNLQRRVGVMVMGRWLSEQEIQSRLAQIAKSNQ